MGLERRVVWEEKKGKGWVVEGKKDGCEDRNGMG